MSRNAIAPPPMRPEHAWTMDYSEVVEFGAYLANRYLNDLDGSENLQSYYAKPWHWTAERACLLAHRAAGLTDPDLNELSDLAHPPAIFLEAETLSEMRAADPLEPDEREDPAIAKADHENDERKDAKLWGR